MKSKIIKTIKYLLISLLLFASFILLINSRLFDEELNPEVIKLMQEKPMPKLEGNVFFGIMGLTAADEKDFMQAGYEIIKTYDENINTQFPISSIYFKNTV